MALPNYGWGVALYNGSPVELDFVLPNIRSHSLGGKLPDPFRDAIPGQLWGKTAFKARVRAICRSQHARRVAAACALGLRKVCLEVIAKKGAMARS